MTSQIESRIVLAGVQEEEARMFAFAYNAAREKSEEYPGVWRLFQAWGGTPSGHKTKLFYVHGDADPLRENYCPMPTDAVELASFRDGHELFTAEHAQIVADEFREGYRCDSPQDI